MCSWKLSADDEKEKEIGLHAKKQRIITFLWGLTEAITKSSMISLVHADTSSQVRQNIFFNVTHCLQWKDLNDP